MKLYFARTWTNLDKYARLFQNESRFSLSNSALSFWLFPLPCPDIDRGTLHLMVDPRLQPIPSFERWLGQMVMLSVLFVKFGKSARHKIKFTSFSGPLNLNVLKWPEMSFWQLSNGITRVSPFRSFLSKLHSPPTIDLKEQQTPAIIVINNQPAGQLSGTSR